MITKTRKQGNSIMVTIPKEFNIPSGVAVEAKKVENGILYTFVQEENDFLDLLLKRVIAANKLFKNLLKENK